MFRCTDTGQWEFELSNATIRYPLAPDAVEGKRRETWQCHPDMAIALIERELTSRVGLWTIQLHVTHLVKPRAEDPLGQREGNKEPLVLVQITYFDQKVNRFMMQHTDQVAEYETAEQVINIIQQTRTRWAIEVHK